MNYLFFVPSISFGGLEMQMVDKAKAAVDRGNRAIVILTKGSRTFDYAKKMGLETDFVDVKVNYFDIFSAIKLSRIIKKNSIDICLVGASKHLSIAVMANKISGTDSKVIFFQHMQSGLNKRDPIHNWIYKNIDGAIVLTRLMQRQLDETTVIDPAKIGVVAHGTNTNKFDPQKFNKIACRQKFNIPENSFAIGYTARIDEQKDQLTLLKAFNELNLENSYLIFAGGTDPEFEEYKKTLEDFIESNNLSTKVKILPFVEDVPSLMNALDVFVITSRSETFGLVIIEAMASGLPAIGVNSGGVPEIIQKDVNGYLIEQRDFKKLAEFLKILYQNENLREKFSKNSREIAILKYDDGIQTAKFFDFCEKINNI